MMKGGASVTRTARSYLAEVCCRHGPKLCGVPHIPHPRSTRAARSAVRVADPHAHKVAASARSAQRRSRVIVPGIASLVCLTASVSVVAPFICDGNSKSSAQLVVAAYPAAQLVPATAPSLRWDAVIQPRHRSTTVMLPRAPEITAGAAPVPRCVRPTAL